MDLKQLERFVITAEEESVGAAAVRLSLSQPALTRSLHMLEELVGGSVFDRLPRGVRLTALGRALLPHAKLILNDRERFCAIADAFNGLVGGALAFAVTPNLEETLGLEAILQFARQHPNISLTVHTTSFADLVGMLQDGRIDLALSTVGSETVPPGVTFEPLFEQMLSIVVGARHALAEADPVSFEALAKESWVVANGASAIEGLRRTFAAHGAPQPFLGVRCQSLTLQKRLLLSGQYVAILDQEVVRDEIETGKVKVLRAGNEGVLLRSGLLYRSDDVRIPAANALAQKVRDGAKGRRR
jgi:LysR family transcriptional regulator of abg operon